MQEPASSQNISHFHGDSGAFDVLEPIARIGALCLGLILLVVASLLAKVNTIIFVAGCIFFWLAVNGVRFREFSVGKDSFKAANSLPNLTKNTPSSDYIPIISNESMPEGLSTDADHRPTVGIETTGMGRARIISENQQARVGIADTIAATGIQAIEPDSIVGIASLSNKDNKFLIYTKNNDSFIITYANEPQSQ